MPASTKTIEKRSSAERGRSADSTPIGMAISIQRIAAPITSEAVIGAADRITSLTLCRLAYEYPRLPCSTS